MPDFERKSLPFELKADSDGEFRAVFATLDVVDHDMDVTRPGAFQDGKEVIVGSWGHKSAELPVGKGVIRERGSEVFVEGKFFKDTQPGRDTYATVKELGALGEWSYVFSVTKQSFGEFEGRQVRFLEGLKVYSVDPVLAGAGIGTRTTDIKSNSRLTFLEHGAAIGQQVDEYVRRVKERVAVREAEGKTLSTDNVASLKALVESLAELKGELEQLLSEPPKNATPEEIAQQALRFQAICARFLSVA